MPGSSKRLLGLIVTRSTAGVGGATGQIATRNCDPGLPSRRTMSVFVRASVMVVATCTGPPASNVQGATNVVPFSSTIATAPCVSKSSMSTTKGPSVAANLIVSEIGVPVSRTKYCGPKVHGLHGAGVTTRVERSRLAGGLRVRSAWQDANSKSAGRMLIARLIKRPVSVMMFV